MSKYFLVKVKFTGSLFFGQGLEERGPLGNTSNYFLHSNYFPQQTGVRGFLRYLLLQINGILYPAGGKISDEAIKKAVDLIGENSEQVGATGRIRDISPVFLFHKETPLFYRPNEFVETCKNKFIPVALKKNVGKAHLFLQKDGNEGGTPAFYLDGFNAKEGFADGFTDSSGIFTPLGEVFKRHLISGNRNSKDGTPDDEAFYKQEFLVMPKEYSFGFWMEVDEMVPDGSTLPVNESRIFSVMGKEQKEVLVHFQETDEMPDFQMCLHDSSLKGNKILLLSDAMVSTGFEERCLFAINQFTPFRHIRSSVKNTTDYAAINQKESKEGEISGSTRRSENKYILKRGSVLFLKDDETSFLNNDEFKKIGYNCFTRIK